MRGMSLTVTDGGTYIDICRQCETTGFARQMLQYFGSDAEGFYEG